MKRVLLLAVLLFAVPIAAYWYQSQDYFTVSKICPGRTTLAS